ncbi:hypothetical protein CRG98_047868 [Punica granatum]|uniref:Uncharacterized protein n=1 Tax=Punica granatum TaxID=22663 RepID=A0A2I0HJ76_PUNGR|nr:hypothetical protein CRG98_047868 [Punica granatum]
MSIAQRPIEMVEEEVEEEWKKKRKKKIKDKNQGIARIGELTQIRSAQVSGGSSEVAAGCSLVTLRQPFSKAEAETNRQRTRWGQRERMERFFFSSGIELIDDTD